MAVTSPSEPSRVHVCDVNVRPAKKTDALARALAGRAAQRRRPPFFHLRHLGALTVANSRAPLQAVAVFGAAALWGSVALAGGFVAPVVELPPAEIAAVVGQPYWLALIPLALIALFSWGGGRNDRMTPLPPGHGGPCFNEGSLIQLERGWVSVEAINVGDRVITSKGVQRILSIGSWLPIAYQDRPCVIDGVRLSPNHGVAVGRFAVPASVATSTRAPIDGSSYFYILVEDHSWLFVKGSSDGKVITAESLQMTADHPKLADQFPELVEHHAAHPVAPRRFSLEESGLQVAA